MCPCKQEFAILQFIHISFNPTILENLILCFDFFLLSMYAFLYSFVEYNCRNNDIIKGAIVHVHEHITWQNVLNELHGFRFITIWINGRLMYQTESCENKCRYMASSLVIYSIPHSLTHITRLYFKWHFSHYIYFWEIPNQ